MTFDIRPSGNQWYFNIMSSNGNVLATSERYWNYGDCKHACELIKQQAAYAPIV